jgi:hypothetical protein
MARRRKLAFWLGFIAIGLLLAEFLIILGVLLLSTQYKGGWDGVIEGFLWLGVPALVAFIGLMRGRENSRAAGLLELILGGLGVIFGIYMGIATFETLTTMGILNQALLFSIFAAGALLVASGVEFLALKREEM